MRGNGAVKRLVLLAFIATQAHAAISFVGQGAVTNATSTATPAIPTGAVGDLIICSAATANPSYTVPQPTAAAYQELASGSTYTFHKVFGRIATGTDTFTLAALPGYTTTSCARFAGTSQNLTTIVDSVTAKRVTLTTLRVGAITPGSANELLYYSTRFHGPGGASVIAAPTSFTELTDNYYTAPDLLTSSGYWIQSALTASAQQDLVLTPAPTVAQSNTSIVLALQPPASGGGGGSSAWSLVGYGTAVGVAAAGTGTPPLPTGHTAGDMLCWVGAERNSVNTLAHPAGYTAVVARQVSGHDVSGIDCKIDSGAEVAPSTVFVGIGMAQMVAFRGGPSPINIDVVGSSSSTCSTSPPSPALAITHYNELVLSFAYLQNDYVAYSPATVAPSAFATGAANVSVSKTTQSALDTTFLLAYYLYPFNTSLAADNFTVTNPTSVACRSHAAAFTGNVAAPAITDVNTTNTFSATATGIVVTGTGFGAVTNVVQLIDAPTTVNQTVTSWGDTSVTFSAVLGNSRYGARTLKVIKSDGTYAIKNVIVSAPVTKCYFDVGTLTQPFSVDKYGAPNRFGDATNDIDDNAQLEFSNMTFTGASTCANITVNDNGSYKVPADLTSLDWLWNSGSTWVSTAASRTGQGKIHIKEAGSFRISCSGTPSDNTAPPVRATATKTICLTGCDYPNTTAGIASCMGAIGNGQSCEMRSRYSDGTTDVWAAQIALSSINGTEASPKTLRVADGDSVTLSQATSSGVALLQLTGVTHVNIQGNSTGSTGLIVGDPTLWAFTCAQATSSPTHTSPTNCYPNDKNTLITSSSDIGLMNLTLHGAAANIASEVANSSSYVYLRKSVVDLHGVNDNKANVLPADSGYLFNVNADHFLAEDTIFSHGGSAAIKITGAFDILRRVVASGTWSDKTAATTYVGSAPLQILSQDCSSATYGCSPYGPSLVEDSEITGAGITPNHATVNFAANLEGLGVIFRKNYLYGATKAYLLTACGTADSVTTAYREGEQQIYNNTLWGGAAFWTNSSTYPSTVDARICQKMVMANNLFQGGRPGFAGAGSIYEMTVNMGNVSSVGYTNAWKGATVFSNIFGVDPANPSANMQVALTGTGAGTKLLTDSTTWPSNFYSNRNVSIVWGNSSQTPSQTRAGLVMAKTSSIGVGDSAPITTTTAAGVSVTSVPVANSRPFKDDWGFSGHTFGGFHTEYGDCIAVGPLTTSTILDAVAVRISNGGVSYSANTLGVQNAISFQSGSPVWKATDNFDGTCGAIWQNKGAAQ